MLPPHQRRTRSLTALNQCHRWHRALTRRRWHILLAGIAIICLGAWVTIRHGGTSGPSITAASFSFMPSSGSSSSRSELDAPESLSATSTGVAPSCSFDPLLVSLDAVSSLSVRRSLFEERLAHAVNQLPSVVQTAAELLHRLDRFVHAVALRNIDEQQGGGGVGSTSVNNMLLFTFGTRDRSIAGAIGWSSKDINTVLHGLRTRRTVWSEVAAPSAAETSEYDMDQVNIREVMSLMYIATMQPASEEKLALLAPRDALTPDEIAWFSLRASSDSDSDPDSPFDSPSSSSEPNATSSSSPTASFPPAPTDPTSTPPKPAIFPLSLLLHRELQRYRRNREGYKAWVNKLQLEIDMEAVDAHARATEHMLHRTHWYSAFNSSSSSSSSSSSAPTQRKCFIPSFVPHDTEAVLQCRCIDTAEEHVRGCRQWREQEEETPESEPDSEHQEREACASASASTSAFRSTGPAARQWPPLSRRELAFALPEARALLERVPPPGLRVAHNNEVDSSRPLHGRSSSSGPGSIDAQLTLLNSSVYRSHPLPWLSGASLFAAPPPAGSANPLYVRLRQLPLRYVSGPSSTTSTFLQLARYLSMTGVEELYLLRLVLVGYLVPLRDHSVAEVLWGAQGAGLKPTIDDMEQAAAAASAEAQQEEEGEEEEAAEEGEEAGEEAGEGDGEEQTEQPEEAAVSTIDGGDAPLEHTGAHRSVLLSTDLEEPRDPSPPPPPPSPAPAPARVSFDFAHPFAQLLPAPTLSLPPYAEILAPSPRLPNTKELTLFHVHDRVAQALLASEGNNNDGLGREVTWRPELLGGTPACSVGLQRVWEQRGINKLHDEYCRARGGAGGDDQQQTGDSSSSIGSIGNGGGDDDGDMGDDPQDVAAATLVADSEGCVLTAAGWRSSGQCTSTLILQHLLKRWYSDNA